ncbi:MAG TPA: hypothetical protein VGQ03_07540 [Nitrososphaera sp.]|nr:hypothetical protein [Nitrososphaera sp.]
MSGSEARFTINVKEGIVELEGKESFVDKHLEKFEEIFKTAVKEAIRRGLEQNISLKAQEAVAALPPGNQHTLEVDQLPPRQEKSSPAKHSPRPSVTIHPIPVDLKAGDSKAALREFYAEKKPMNHYEKVAVFAYYLAKMNKQKEVKFGELLSCYEEVNEKKPSILDIIKNSLRYKGWLEQGSEKYSTRLSISGENFVKFDLPAKAGPTNLVQT